MHPTSPAPAGPATRCAGVFQNGRSDVAPYEGGRLSGRNFRAKAHARQHKEVTAKDAEGCFSAVPACSPWSRDSEMKEEGIA
jgi:hypothetical protein